MALAKMLIWRAISGTAKSAKLLTKIYLAFFSTKSIFSLIKSLRTESLFLKEIETRVSRYQWQKLISLFLKKAH